MRLDVVRAPEYGDEWCVTVDGKYVVGFAGPDARDRAERHRDELRQLLMSVPGASADPRRRDADRRPRAR